MSVVQKVVILNKPLKVLEFTPFQWLVMGLAACIACIAFQQVPGYFKIANVGLNIWVAILIICAAIVFVKATEIKPMQWWVNMIFYRLRFMPTKYLPHPETAPIYPDATIIDAQKKSETSEFYIGEDPDRPSAYRK
jgi:hypothetical protein